MKGILALPARSGKARRDFMSQPCAVITLAIFRNKQRNLWIVPKLQAARVGGWPARPGNPFARTPDHWYVT
jgi:hypothetical protein